VACTIQLRPPTSPPAADGFKCLVAITVGAPYSSGSTLSATLQFVLSKLAGPDVNVPYTVRIAGNYNGVPKYWNWVPTAPAGGIVTGTLSQASQSLTGSQTPNFGGQFSISSTTTDGYGFVPTAFSANGIACTIQLCPP